MTEFTVSAQRQQMFCLSPPEARKVMTLGQWAEAVL